MGAGFSLAMRDLEIRGAGNLLGTQQSGHIATVGYELYCRLLEQSVRGIKSMPPAEPPQVTIDLPGEAWLPRDFIPDFRTKIDVYRRLSRTMDDAQIDDLAAELLDRFGPLPAESKRLMEFARLRVAAAALGIDSVTREAGMLALRYHDRSAMESLKATGPAAARLLRIVDHRTAYLPVENAVWTDSERLLQAVRTLLRPARARPYSPRPPADLTRHTGKDARP